MGRRYKDNWMGALAAFRWPLAISVAAAWLWWLSTRWPPAPLNGEIGSLGILVWGRVVAMSGSIAAVLVLAAILACALGWLGMEPASRERQDEP